mmetsp:Transcript_23210/g.34616  ORF Transcript_23210/g.34616 Transcript_23210/m.34616 type:complete len:93 (+) Transcript_23210:662-940(+)
MVVMSPFWIGCPPDAPTLASAHFKPEDRAVFNARPFGLAAANDASGNRRDAVPPIKKAFLIGSNSTERRETPTATLSQFARVTARDEERDEE